ncbi:hypothetical protein RI129_012962 [Pyrocoelia pectoralis]|uniref:acid phosphatase n=1 Tax=Pyrocoelia pectoralis TaxID=417401 RepID=A0AAN7UZF8_9COLE
MSVTFYFKIPKVCLLLLLAVAHSKCEDVDELLGVIVFYRHGDRAPLVLYQTDPYNESTYWPMGLGQLTNLGKMQLYELGQWLKERYGEFLSVSDSYVRSTDYDRTLMSAECCLAGLFPPDPNQTWNIQVNWQPVAIHTTSLAMDPVLAMEEPCERYEALYHSLLNTKKFLHIHEENQELYDYITKNANFPVDSFQSLQLIHDTLHIEELYNLTLPDWTKHVYPDKMNEWAWFSFALATYTQQLARLKTGPLFNEIYNNIRKASQNLGPKMYMYSGHDSTIAAILDTLKIFDIHHPPYGATILFELRSRQNASFVNIFYKNATVPAKMTLNGCSFDCPLEKFYKILNEIRLDYEEWKLECSIPLRSVQSMVFNAFFGILFMIFSIFIILIMCNMRSISNYYVRIPSTKSNI